MANIFKRKNNHKLEKPTISYLGSKFINRSLKEGKKDRWYIGNYSKYKENENKSAVLIFPAQGLNQFKIELKSNYRNSDNKTHISAEISIYTKKIMGTYQYINTLELDGKINSLFNERGVLDIKNIQGIRDYIDTLSLVIKNESNDFLKG